MKLLLFNFTTDENNSFFGFTADWIRAFAEQFEKVFVITSHKGHVELPNNVEIFSLGAENRHGWLRKLWIFMKIMMRLRKESLDLTFFHMTTHFVILAWPFLKLYENLKGKKIPRILWYAHRSVPWTLRIATKLVDRIVTTSDLGYQIKSSKKRIVGHGLSETRFTPSIRVEHKPFTLLSVSRLSPIKRIELLIEGVTAFQKTHTEPIRFWILGEEPGGRLEYTKKLQQKIHELGLEKTVTFLGAQNYAKIPSILGQSDLCLSASNTGALDKAVLESMLSGIPVLAPSKAYQSVFTELDFSKDCLLEEDNAEEIAEKISIWKELSSKEKDRRTTMLSAHAKEKYGLSSLIGKILSLQEEVLG